MKLMPVYAKQSTLYMARLTTSILMMSFEEEICKTCAETDHHDRAAQCRSSLPQDRRPQLGTSRIYQHLDKTKYCTSRIYQQLGTEVTLVRLAKNS
jgi:hypothetical protein